MDWIDVNEQPTPTDRIHLLVDGDSVYLRGTELQPFFVQLSGAMKRLCDCNFTHWKLVWNELPEQPKKPS